MLEGRLSPQELRLIIGIAVSSQPEQWASEIEQRPGGKLDQMRRFLESRDLVGPDGIGNDRLRFWLDHVCSTPFPVVKEHFEIPDRGPKRNE